MLHTARFHNALFFPSLNRHTAAFPMHHKGHFLSNITCILLLVLCEWESEWVSRIHARKQSLSVYIDKGSELKDKEGNSLEYGLWGVWWGLKVYMLSGSLIISNGTIKTHMAHRGLSVGLGVSTLSFQLNNWLPHSWDKPTHSSMVQK